MTARGSRRCILVVVVAVAALCGACSSGGNASDAGSMPGTGGRGGAGGAAGAVACSTTSSSGGAATGPTLGCAGWRVDSAPGTAATVSVGSGALMFRSPWAPASAGLFNDADIALSQASLCGDFDITVVWHDFQSGGAISSRLQAGVWWRPSGGGLVHQATAEVRGSGTGSVAIVNDNDAPQAWVESPMPIDGSSGSFRIVRAAGFITVTTMIRTTATVELRSANEFPDQPYTLFLEFGHGPISSDADNKTGVATVQVDSVTVTGGGGAVMSDDFSCAN